MSFKALKKAVTKSSKDKFEVGTVVRWVSAGVYTYAAIKTPVGWYTTASYTNSYVDKQLDFEGLLEILGRSETSNVGVAEPAAFVPVEEA